MVWKAWAFWMTKSYLNKGVKQSPLQRMDDMKRSHVSQGISISATNTTYATELEIPFQPIWLTWKSPFKKSIPPDFSPLFRFRISRISQNARPSCSIFRLVCFLSSLHCPMYCRSCRERYEDKVAINVVTYHHSISCNDGTMVYK